MTVRSHASALAVLVAASLIAAGCAVGPSTDVRPASPPATSRTERALPRTARAFLDSLGTARTADRPDSAARSLWTARAMTPQEMQDLGWLSIVRDSTLLQLVQSAIANNRDVATARSRIEEYRADQGIAGSALYPQLALNGGASVNKAAFGPATIKYQALRTTADLAWELDFWGRIRRQRQAATFDLLGREEDTRATVLTLVSDVATTYLALRASDENVRIAEATRASRDTTLELARRRFAQGLISELDVRQFEAEVADPAARVAQFALQRAQQENALSLLLGQPAGAIPRGRPLEEVIQAVNVPDSVPGDLITRRPDVMRAQRDLQAAVARVGAALASRFPTISVSGSYGAQRPNLGTLYTPQGQIYTLQAGVSLPIFTGGRLRDQERAAQARADEARSQYEQTVLAALREASDALASVRLDRDQLVAQETQTRALGIAAAIAERRYASGVSSYLEVLDAQRSLFTAQLSLVQAEQQYLAATVTLFRALGGSWTGVAPAR
jgi:multidrug efflux system outer membrane protein